MNNIECTNEYVKFKNKKIKHTSNMWVLDVKAHCIKTINGLIITRCSTTFLPEDALNVIYSHNKWLVTADDDIINIISMREEINELYDKSEKLYQDRLQVLNLIEQIEEILEDALKEQEVKNDK